MAHYRVLSFWTNAIFVCIWGIITYLLTICYYGDKLLLVNIVVKFQIYEEGL